jgi:hypothetical protein
VGDKPHRRVKLPGVPKSDLNTTVELIGDVDTVGWSILIGSNQAKNERLGLRLYPGGELDVKP